MSRSNHRIERRDILEMADYAATRKQRRNQMVARKRHRRVAVGPDVTLYFENYDTMWYQVHEMLHAEGGGEPQIADELDAYNPLVPDGRELVATMMIEIGDEGRRKAALARLGGIEKTISIAIADEKIEAVPETDVERTTKEGKTSAVHFLHFRFTDGQVALFGDPERPVVVAIDHPQYGHMAVIPVEVRDELGGDFD